MIDETISLKEAPRRQPGASLTRATGKNPIPIRIEGVLTLGRDARCDVQLRDPHVSQRHCQIEKRPHGYFIRDLASRNGIQVNGMKLLEGQLKNMSRIQVGEVEFIFQTDKGATTEAVDLESKNKNWAIQLKSIEQIARTDMPVFLQGESGTGKEVLAQAIHSQSYKRNGPLISVNCSALTETLVESELFGHVKGSFTGATGDRKGAFEAARGGTLFLDEIGDLPLSLQPKILRALENSEIRPVGSDRVVATDVRVITATHKNLEQLVQESKFRADLFFRVNVIKFSIPPLRSRMEDFDDLLYHFCKQIRARFSVNSIAALKTHIWPGNIRELKNTVSRASAIFQNELVQPQHLRQIVDIRERPKSGRTKFDTYSFLGSIDPEISDGGSLLKEIEKEVIKLRLKANHGNQRRTAMDLGIAKSTLHDRIRLYQIDVQSFMEVEGFEKNAAHAAFIEDMIEAPTKTNF